MAEEKKQKTGIARLLEISAQKSGLLVWAVIFSSLSGVLQFVPFYSAFRAIQEVALNYGALTQQNINYIMTWVFIGVGCMAGGFVCMYIGSMCSHTAAFKILYGLRMNLAKKLTQLPLGFHMEHSTGEIRKILELNVEKTEQWIAHALPDYVSGMVGFIVIIALMFSVNVWLALTFFVVVIISVLIASRFSAGEKGMESVRKYQTALERINSSTVQYVNGMPAVKIFNHSADSFQTLKTDIENYRDYSIEQTKAFRPIYTVLLAVIKGIALFILPVSTLILSRNPTSLEFALSVAMFLILSPGIVAPVFKVVGIGSVIKDISGGVERIDMIFDAQPLAEPEKDTRPTTFDIQFNDVRFSYNENAENPVYALNGINFTAHEKKITALVGASGGGKSTCAQLVPRFWDINQGTIKIGGVNIKDIKQDTLNELVSFVFQDSFLFFDTIRENIRAGVTDATEEQIVAAAKAAQCHDFIVKLPDGYDTLIGEGGIFLSGGEEQRINIARAILKNAPILLLDEATAFADPENEAMLYGAIKSLIKNKTVIMIAHRLSTIIDADQIVVIDDGRVQENGTHTQLMEKNGEYSRLYAAYIKNTEWYISEAAQ
ncbi:MAG: ABC transporter ATP-binding protein [Oscillospiraceae bacterium]